MNSVISHLCILALLAAPFILFPEKETTEQQVCQQVQENESNLQMNTEEYS